MRRGVRTGLAVAMAFGLALGGAVNRAQALALDDEVKEINTIRDGSTASKKKADDVKKDAQDTLEQVKKKFGADSDTYKKFKQQVDDLTQKLDAAQKRDQRREDRAVALLRADHDEEIRLLDQFFPPESADCGCKGQLLVDGSPGPGFADEGGTVTLLFRFADVVTGLAADPAPPIASVRFQVNRDPATPGLFDPIGASSGSGGLFSLSFTIDSFEPLFDAIPYDAAGAPIFIEGLNGENEARAFNLDIPGGAAPEPGVWALMILGLGGVGLAMRRRRADLTSAT